MGMSFWIRKRKHSIIFDHLLKFASVIYLELDYDGWNAKKFFLLKKQNASSTECRPGYSKHSSRGLRRDLGTIHLVRTHKKKGEGLNRCAYRGRGVKVIAYVLRLGCV